MSGSAETLARLTRWVEHGGALSASEPGRDGHVTVSLLRCDGGEEADRLTTDDPVVLRWLAGRYDATHGAASCSSGDRRRPGNS